MNYAGWHLAAAVPRASKTLPALVKVGTSGAHGKLKMLWTATHPMKVWFTTSKEKMQFGSVALHFALSLFYI